MGEALMVYATRSADETRAVGREFASCLKPGDVVLLSGDLGAGKTQFVQGIAAGLGVAETPISPTFNIVLSYSSGRMPLHHFDLYRLDSLQQLEDIGVAEYVESDGVCLVEWAEKFPRAFEPAYRVSIAKTGETGREIRIEVGPGEQGSSEGEHRFPVGKRALVAEKCEDAELSDSDAAFSAAGLGDAGSAAHTPRNGGGVESDAGARGFVAPDELRASAGSSDVRRSTSDTTRGEGPQQRGASGDARFVLAVDTANEVVALGVGELVASAAEKRVRIVATREIAAHQASNTTLVPAIAQLLGELGIVRSQLACLCVGRGPGSFTGVRICMAAAKGMAQALGVGLVGVSTLDAIAWNAWAFGVRGSVAVVADAMRKEVYPVR